MGLIECGWATCDERDLVEKEAVATFTPPMLRLLKTVFCFFSRVIELGPII